MRQVLFHFVIKVYLFLSVQSQNYYLSFTASGESNSIDSIIVENLSQCKKITINGNDILNLVCNTDFSDHSINENYVFCYPNPSKGQLQIILNSYISDETFIRLYDMYGKLIFENFFNLPAGKHQFELNSLPPGVLYLSIENKYNKFNQNLISLNNNFSNPTIKYKGITKEIPIERNKQYENINFSVIQMQYNYGDKIKFLAFSGIYKTVLVAQPQSNQTINFTFVRCVDNNGNSYAVVKIGNQWWMAENLNSGIYANITSPQISGTKFCMNINGVADPTCPMGGLYEWHNLMKGASGCNGSGPPPNDRCPTPVKGLCPDGWHIPSHYEWTTLLRNISNNPNAFPYNMNSGVFGTNEGGMLKENCSDFWWSPNAGATNITGFTALPGGDTWAGVFEDYGQSAYFWTSTAYFNYSPWVYALNYSVPMVGRSFYVPENGFSCRCVKD